jgi:hypothetical protein
VPGWALVPAIAAPLALCAAAIAIVAYRNRRLRRRPGNVPVRLRRAGKTRWLPAHGVWAHDVFAVRAAPAAWKEALLWVADVRIRPANAEERKRLHRIGERPVISIFELAAGGLVEIAARDEHADALLGPFADPAA